MPQAAGRPVITTITPTILVTEMVSCLLTTQILEIVKLRQVTITNIVVLTRIWSVIFITIIVAIRNSAPALNLNLSPSTQSLKIGPTTTVIILPHSMTADPALFTPINNHPSNTMVTKTTETETLTESFCAHPTGASPSHQNKADGQVLPISIQQKHNSGYVLPQKWELTSNSNPDQENSTVPQIIYAIALLLPDMK